MNLTLWIIAVFFVLLSASIVFFFIRKTSGTRSIFKARQEVKEILEKAREEAGKIKREASLVANEKYLNFKADFERQTRDRRRKFN
ncbi:MAG: DUF3552 domain-containing protein, partial [Candidatus Aminicenantes bacterium]|nr:DUF3552 domain-containing protein [Candidatus Aminicenantes bacterium]